MFHRYDDTRTQFKSNSVMIKDKNKINNLYLPSAKFIAQVLVGPSIKLHKQII